MKLKKTNQRITNWENDKNQLENSLRDLRKRLTENQISQIKTRDELKELENMKARN